MHIPHLLGSTKSGQISRGELLLLWTHLASRSLLMVLPSTAADPTRCVGHAGPTVTWHHWRHRKVVAVAVLADDRQDAFVL